MIAIVDYGMGNLHSVHKALEAIGEESRITAKAEDLRSASHIILPGVGAFGQCASGLRATGLVDVLSEEVRDRGKPFLGICVGMQLLVERSDEGGDDLGLGWFKGIVRRLDAAPDRKVPHMGWNDVDAAADAPMFKGLRNRVFYFVHSYFVDLADRTGVTATCDYGVAFPAALTAGNIWAVQFHPEKSQQNGLKLLRNFVTRV
jgi:glutamine amidotransferase